ncbi:MAG: HAMP domain-containing protein [Actinobacteria bacterium]|nr:HAMP domain-containing protein [Actinomycetota bacterium]
MRPLDRIRSIKTKLGLVIVAAVAVTLVVHSVGPKFGLYDWVAAVAAAAVALAMVQFLARGMTSPLREMAAAASAMAKGDYSRRVTATSRDEVGQLAAAFNRMAADLHEVDRMRRDLVANVSHELRTPISALQVVLENLVDGVEPPDRQTLHTMLRQVERLSRLVSQLLDLSRLESGAVPLQKEPVEARSLLEEAARDTDFKSHIEAKHVRVEVSVEPESLAFEADVERVHQVLANLLDNAMRHSPDGGTIQVAARADDGSVRIEVRDEGPGINEEEATRIFERFYRSDHARSSNEGGTGLGLSIARWIVELHGGDIRAENRDEHEGGHGCRMVVTLPR